MQASAVHLVRTQVKRRWVVRGSEGGTLTQGIGAPSFPQRHGEGLLPSDRPVKSLIHLGTGVPPVGLVRRVITSLRKTPSASIPGSLSQRNLFEHLSVLSHRAPVPLSLWCRLTHLLPWDAEPSFCFALVPRQGCRHLGPSCCSGQSSTQEAGGYSDVFPGFQIHQI